MSELSDWIVLFCSQYKGIDIPREILVQILKSPAALEVSRLLSVSGTSSKESKRMSWVFDWIQMFRNVLEMLGGIYVHIWKS